MKIVKAGTAQASGAPTPEALEAIHAFAKGTLTAEEVYTFSILLCDNEVDRDFERFPVETLQELQGLFVGKTGIFDHDWRSGNQKARIYRTELVREQGRHNSLGEPYTYLKGEAYMLRTAGNAELIAEIEGGIRRETSVGCAVKRRVCSICGQEMDAPGCAHEPGAHYDGRLCYAELLEASDAYEWSFVAVPAQPQAGVLHKGRDGGAPSARRRGQLEKEAALGRQYLAELRREVRRLGLLWNGEFYKALEGPSARMEAEELLALKAALEAQLSARYPAETQLPGLGTAVRFDGSAYQI